jgi:hypothetical protein
MFYWYQVELQFFITVPMLMFHLFVFYLLTLSITMSVQHQWQTIEYKYGGLVEWE